MSYGELIIRVDASTEIGTGHLMRCLALGQAWKDAGGQVSFVTSCQSEGLLQRLRAEEFGLHMVAEPYPHPDDWDYARGVLAAFPNAWVVLDGYHFDEVYQQRVKQSGHRLLVIDDVAHLKHYYADIVLNQNLHAEQLHYSCEPHTRLLLGTRYALLRREFQAWRDWKREVPEAARRILVTLGGSDPENNTLKVIQALHRVDASDVEATVVVGASNPHIDELGAAVEKSRIPVRLFSSPLNMAELMASTDIAVSSASSTFWELAFMGVPGIVLVWAANQRYVGEELEKLGLAVTIRHHRDFSLTSIALAITELLKTAEVRRRMSNRGRELVDGRGVERVIAEIPRKVLL